jgi:thymidine kinase
MSYKLYFKYGTMNSSKTMNLLMVVHNYEKQNKKIILIKPKIDDRFGEDYITSRTGFRRKADLVLGALDVLPTSFEKDIACVLVDEAQFLSPKQVEDLRLITLTTPVICYGLRTDYMSNLFPGSKRLMELADSIEEIKTICTYCSTKSVINMKYINGIVIKTGDPSLDLGCEEKYLPVCWKCWHNKEEVPPTDQPLDSYFKPVIDTVDNYDYDILPTETKLDMALFTSREEDTLDYIDDTNHYPEVTKEQLDHEIDKYNLEGGENFQYV